jgi:hypothetical protein
MRKIMPLSIGTHGGGQQAGLPVVPPGGGAGAEKTLLAVNMTRLVYKNFKCFIAVVKI